MYSNRNHRRRKIIRWQKWDYSWPGRYFITICTKNRVHYFGEIRDGKMILSNVGVIADILWYEIKNHAKNVELDAFIVMPNHIHGILILKNEIMDGGDNMDVGNMDGRVRACPDPAIPDNDYRSRRFRNPGKNTVSSIIGSYKSAVSRHAHRLGYDFEWQSRFWDVIIRSDEEFYRIRNYIKNNVKNWKEEKFH